MNDIIRVHCSCCCEDGFVINFDFSEEYGYATISTVAAGFYTKYGGPFQIIKDRIKSAWFMLTGKEYLLHEIMLNKTQWNEFVEAVNKVKN